MLVQELPIIIRKQDLVNMRGIIYQSRSSYSPYLQVDPRGILQAKKKVYYIRPSSLDKKQNRDLVFQYTKQETRENSGTEYVDEGKLATFLCSHTDGLPVELLPTFITASVTTKFNAQSAKQLVETLKKGHVDKNDKKRMRTILGLGQTVKYPIISIDDVVVTPDLVKVYLLMNSMMTRQEQKKYLAAHKDDILAFIIKNAPTKELYKDLFQDLSKKCTMDKFSLPLENIACIYLPAKPEAIPLVSESIDTEDEADFDF